MRKITLHLFHKACALATKLAPLALCMCTERREDDMSDDETIVMALWDAHVKVDVDVGMVANVNTNVDTHLACSIILPIIVTPSRTPRIGRNFWVN